MALAPRLDRSSARIISRTREYDRGRAFPEDNMTTRVSTLTRLGLGLAASAALLRAGATDARLLAAETIPIDTDDIAGVVTGAAGPEAGVWVIAETSDLPTKFVRIVVTDDRGRYVM